MVYVILENSRTYNDKTWCSELYTDIYFDDEDNAFRYLISEKVRNMYYDDQLEDFVNDYIKKLSNDFLRSHLGVEKYLDTDHFTYPEVLAQTFEDLTLNSRGKIEDVISLFNNELKNNHDDALVFIGNAILTHLLELDINYMINEEYYDIIKLVLYKK